MSDIDELEKILAEYRRGYIYAVRALEEIANNGRNRKMGFGDIMVNHPTYAQLTLTRLKLECPNCSTCNISTESP